MGKGETDAKIIIDTDGAGTNWRVVFDLWDDLLASDIGGLKAKAAVSQSAFDAEADGIWDWYDNQPGDFKARLRSSFLAL